MLPSLLLLFSLKKVSCVCILADFYASVIEINMGRDQLVKEPAEAAPWLALNCINPAFPVTKARNGPDVPNWNLGPKRPVMGRTLLLIVVVVPPLVPTVV